MRPCRIDPDVRQRGWSLIRLVNDDNTWCFLLGRVHSSAFRFVVTSRQLERRTIVTTTTGSYKEEDDTISSIPSGLIHHHGRAVEFRRPVEAAAFSYLIFFLLFSRVRHDTAPLWSVLSVLWLWRAFSISIRMDPENVAVSLSHYK